MISLSSFSLSLSPLLSSPLLSSPLLSSPLLSSPLVAKFHTEKHLPFLSTLTAKQWAKIAMEKVLLILTHSPLYQEYMSLSLSLSPHYLQIVQNVLCQPDGLPVYYICSQILESAWAQYVVKEKTKRGIADKVGYFLLSFHLSLFCSISYLSLPPSFLFPSLLLFYPSRWYTFIKVTTKISVDPLLVLITWRSVQENCGIKEETKPTYMEQL